MLDREETKNIMRISVQLSESAHSYADWIRLNLSTSTCNSGIECIQTNSIDWNCCQTNNSWNANKIVCCVLCRSMRIVILHLTKSAIQSSFSLLSPLSKTCNSSSSDALYVMKSSSNSYRVIVFDDALAEQRWTLHSPQQKPKTRLRSESKRRRMECR